ncbi:MAG: class I SAM-dependent methyltransferase [Phycisphaerae bacterium]|nr:class I SAM-dependent methyltransferase [Phycisphaerae bacterium]
MAVSTPTRPRSAGKTTSPRAQRASKPAKAAKPSKSGARRGWRTAATSDPHELYELSVQNVEFECDFIDRVWKAHRGRVARSLREDFCGTFAASVEWITRRPTNVAIGVDLDPYVLAWGRSYNLPRLPERDRARLEIREADVMTVRTPQVDCVVAMNFSYYLFKKREQLLAYFRRVHAALVKDGLFVLDSYGGSDSFREIEEERNLDGFTYVWDQNLYNPVTGDVVNYIHFRFPDGTELSRAFTYEWRLWTLPEIQEALLEVGFKKITVYWEGTNHTTGEGNGRFRPSRRGEACEGWIAYLVAEM